MARPFVVVGIPGHRRVTLFQAALAAQGLPEARVISWRDLAEPGAPATLLADLPDDAIVRIDSMGEDDDVERAMLRVLDAFSATVRMPSVHTSATRLRPLAMPLRA